MDTAWWSCYLNDEVNGVQRPPEFGAVEVRLGCWLDRALVACDFIYAFPFPLSMINVTLERLPPSVMLTLDR